MQSHKKSNIMLEIAEEKAIILNFPSNFIENLKTVGDLNSY
jgi:hypothetical protein